MPKLFASFKEFLELLLGLDGGWKKEFDIVTNTLIGQVRDKFARTGRLRSGMVASEITLLKMKRDQEKRDESRKRLIEGLSVIPSWLALLLSIVAILFSILG